MSEKDERPLASGIAPPRVDGARMTRTWARVHESLAARPKRTSRRWVAPVAFAMAAAVLALVVRSQMLPSPAIVRAPVTLETAPSLILPDGSRIFEAPGTRLALRSATVERVELSLESGEIDLDVTHVEGRRFMVLAAGHEVAVLGTRFKVRLMRGAPDMLDVSVERGRVRVVGPLGDVVLGEGQRWSTAVARSDGSNAAPPATPTPLAPPEITGTGETPSSTAGAVASMATAAPARSTGSAMGADDGPKELFGRAVEARRAGRDRDAAAAFDGFRRRFRGDTRAGLAAFELGRIRLDSLRDAAGAVEAFTDAITLSPSAPFREDAEARRVDALDMLGDRARCEDARAKYLTRYPAGLHVPRITQRCASR